MRHHILGPLTFDHIRIERGEFGRSGAGFFGWLVVGKRTSILMLRSSIQPSPRNGIPKGRSALLACRIVATPTQAIRVDERDDHLHAGHQLMQQLQPFGVIAAVMKVTAVRFPPGRFMLVMRPSLIGSPPNIKRTGILAVVAFAARAALLSTMSATWRWPSRRSAPPADHDGVPLHGIQSPRFLLRRSRCPQAGRSGISFRSMRCSKHHGVKVVFGVWSRRSTPLGSRTVNTEPLTRFAGNSQVGHIEQQVRWLRAPATTFC